MREDRATLAVLTIAALVVGFASPARAETFVVSNVLDAGPGSLRQAILDANAVAGHDTGARTGLPVATRVRPHGRRGPSRPRTARWRCGPVVRPVNCARAAILEL